jgi:hypothetical protein
MVFTGDQRSEMAIMTRLLTSNGPAQRAIAILQKRPRTPIGLLVAPEPARLGPNVHSGPRMQDSYSSGIRFGPWSGASPDPERVADANSSKNPSTPRKTSTPALSM